MGRAHGSSKRRRAQEDSEVARAWKLLKKTAPLRKQVQFLYRPEVVAVFGYARVATLLINLDRKLSAEKSRLALQAPSETWMDRAVEDGEKFPPPLDRNAMSLAELRRDTAMVEGRGQVRYGDGLARRRFTPDIAVEVEDELDELGIDEARFRYSYPPSCSAVMLMAIRNLFGPSLYRSEVGRASASNRRRGRASGRRRRALIPCTVPDGAGGQTIVYA